MIHIWRNREELEHQVITLDSQGVSWRVISTTVGVSRNTVKGIVRAHKRRRDRPHSALEPPPPRAPRPSKVDPFLPRVKALFEQYSDITAQRVYETLQEEGFDGGYTAVKKAVRRLRPKSKPKPSLATPVYDPGEMAECDWSPYVDVPFGDGSQHVLQAFGYTLVHSRRKYFGFFLKSDLHALMDGHVQSFERFGGLAKGCKYDSQKPVVLRWEGQQPIYNPRFIAFATYYEFKAHALLGNPNGKPRVERSFWELVRSFFNGRSFHDFTDLQAQLAHWLDTIVDHRRRYGSTALERFTLEQPHLRPLPSHHYDTARVTHRICSIDGFVDWEGNRYAVPYDHVTDILPVRITQHELFIYGADLSCIARHELAPRGQGLKLDPHGFHPPAGHRAAADADQLRATFESMGEQAAEFFRLMSQAPPRSYCHQARLILKLRSRFDTEDILPALAHAARHGALRADSVEQILVTTCRPRTFEEYVSEQTAQRLAETIGMDSTEPRNLVVYDSWRVSGLRQPPAANQESTSCENALPMPVPLPSPTQSQDQNQPKNVQSTPTMCCSDCADTSNSSD
ncbi:MAG: IS21 family transposase [Deltaproteobacteria bacterium]|nr:IS21 family transposase [Deltaproteobacteria bacterium]